MSKYGVENPSQAQCVKEKKRRTFMAHYGVDNVWKSPKYCAWLSDYMLLNYGVKRITTNPWGWSGAGEKLKRERIKKLWAGRDKWWESLSDEEKSNLAVALCAKNDSVSKLETRIADSLARLRIGFTSQFALRGRSFDFKIHKSKILIEVNGDFWHANPAQYKANELVHLPGKPMKASKLWEKDNKKVKLAEINGYSVVTIWETELNKMDEKELDLWVTSVVMS